MFLLPAATLDYFIERPPDRINLLRMHHDFAYLGRNRVPFLLWLAFILLVVRIFLIWRTLAIAANPDFSSLLAVHDYLLANRDI
jgi:hypothetical protein